MLVPVVPSSLLESLEAPQPILAGITRKDFNVIEASYEMEDDYG